MRSRYLWLLGALFLMGVGCADSAKSPSEPTPDGGMIIPDPDAAVTPQPDMGEGPVVPGSRELVIDGDINVIVFYGETRQLPVFYRRADGSPVPAARVTATMLDMNGAEANSIEGSRLRTLSATTDANGRAVFDLQGGNLPVDFQVRATAPGAADVFWNAFVSQPGQGTLQVRVNFDEANSRYGFVDVTKTRITLFDNQNCAALDRTPTDLLGALLEQFIDPFNAVRNRATVRELGDGATFAVAVQGQTSTNATITFGCTDNVTIVGGEVTDVEVDLRDLPIQFKGLYLVESQFDLTSILTNSENDTLNTVGTVLRVIGAIGGGIGDGEYPRGNAIIDLICEYADIGDGTCATIRGFGARLIDEVINNTIPMDVLNVLNIIGDIYRIVSEFTIVGEFEFINAFPDENNMLAGNDHRWQAFQFVWRNNCPFNTLEECTRTFGNQELGLDRRAIAGVFDAELNGAEMHIMPHSMTLKYGVIILGLAETWIIPAILNSQGPITLEDLFNTLIPCEDVNDALSGNPQSGLCEEVFVQALSELLVDQISRLEFDLDQFNLEGWVTPADTTGSLSIDSMPDGEWSGTVTIGGNDLVFEGSFRGCLRGGPDQPCDLPE
ncbi:MAG: carboxypeptidase-like regulatory domain-containing protein [Bradymonadia bacterium]